MDDAGPAPGLSAEKRPQLRFILLSQSKHCGAAMPDRNHQDFQGRIGRIERVHNQGGGFESPGTLGMSYYSAHRRRRRLPRWPLTILVMLVILFMLKAMLHVVIGPSAYDAKVASLRAGSDLDRVGATLLQSDPVTLLIAEKIRWIKG